MSLRLLTGMIAIVVLLAGPVASAQQSDLCASAHNPTVDPADFRTPDGHPIEIDNRYFPLQPGTFYTYRGESEGEVERGVVYVTHERTTILGIRSVVVQDAVYIGGKLAEQTYDWYAQDQEGNVWYLGEYSTEYDEDGNVIDHSGSWESGVDGAKPGIVMEAQPTVGDIYRQEYYEGEAEDVGEVVALGQSVKVPNGTFDDLLQTKDTSCFEDLQEYKHYAPGVGLVRAVAINGDERLELVEVETGEMPSEMPTTGGGGSAQP